MWEAGRRSPKGSDLAGEELPVWRLGGDRGECGMKGFSILRQSLFQDIGTAHAAGARPHLACKITGIDLRTLQRWKVHEGLTAGDDRPHAVRPPPSHAPSGAELAELVRAANEPRFAPMPPARIVPMLPDDGVYLASESTVSRVLREDGQAAHRGRAKEPRAVRPPTPHVATAPRQVWCWDMTYLPR